MANKQSFWKRFRLVYRPSPLALKIVLLVAIVLCTATLLTLRIMIHKADQKAESLRNEAAWYEKDNAKQDENISQLGTEKSIRRIATEELGLVDPDATFFEGVESTEP